MHVSVKLSELALADLRELHKAILSKLRTITSDIKAGHLTKEDLADICLLLRDTGEMADDLKKECNQVMDDAGDSAALLWTLDVAVTSSLKAIQGQFATGVVKQKCYPKLPSKTREPERHHSLMVALGFSGGEDSGIFTISWPRLVEKLSADYAAGRALPAGIKPDDLGMKPKLEVRRKNQA